MTRVVLPEILDGLAAEDPAAVRSRRDLRMINALMGNHRWILSRVGDKRAIELGAGDGALAGKLARVTALDLAPEPVGLPDSVEWVQGDFFETFENANGEVVVACLILHHFEEEALGRLGRLIGASSVSRVVAAEPHRSRVAMGLGYGLFPLVNAVTRHDMIVSIRAGFRVGELGGLLGLDTAEWEVKESATLLGGIRFEASRR